MNLLFAFLLSMTANAQYRGNSLVLYDASGEILGSATHFCSRDKDNLTFITTAHEVEASACAFSSGCLAVTNGLGPQGRAVELVKIDSSKDFAVLKTPRTAFDFHNASCVDPNWTLNIDRTSPSVMDIDATIGLPEKKFAIEGYDFREKKMVRQEFTASIAKTKTAGLPGREGTGQLYVLKGNVIPGYSGGAVLEQDPESLMGTRQIFKGIILAVGEGKMVVLPASEIRKALEEPSRRAERSDGRGGVQYLAEKAVHYRSAVQEAGRGRMSDGGRGRASDGSTRSSPGQFGSGISFLSNPKRRWLSISDYWSEAEPFPLGRRGDLLNPDRLQGIYEENGQLFATSSATPMPRFLINTEKCGPQAAVVHAANGIRTQQNVEVCGFTTANESGFSIAAGGVTFKITLQKNCAGGGVCLVTRQAVKISGGKASDLKMDGIRTIFDGPNRLTVEYGGGYALKLGSTKIVGPLLLTDR